MAPETNCSNSAKASGNMTSASTEAMAAPWETGASSSLDRADGSAEDLMAQMNSAGESAGTKGHSYAKPGPNATFDETSVRPPPANTTGDTAAPSSVLPSSEEVDGDDAAKKQPPSVKVATANIKYKNQAGRAAILAVSTAVHHDFGALTSILNVTLPADAITDLKRNPDVEWVDGNGAVYFVQPWKY